MPVALTKYHIQAADIYVIMAVALIRHLKLGILMCVAMVCVQIHVNRLLIIHTLGHIHVMKAYVRKTVVHLQIMIRKEK